MEAYEDALSKCSTAHAPWHIVPADRKWYRNYVVAKTVAETLRGYKNEWMDKLARVGEASLAELAAYRAEHPLSSNGVSAKAAKSNGRKAKKK
jgi:hypothetical protein